MKNYFNASERTRHIILIGMQDSIKKFSDSNALTDEEARYLKNITRNLNKFNESVFERLGDPYKRKIVNTMEVNELGLYSRFGKEKECISNCATEDLEPAIKDLQIWKCCDCEKTCDFHDCAVYAISVACDMDGNGKEEGCPFKW